MLQKESGCVLYQDILLGDRPPRVSGEEAMRGGEHPFAADEAPPARGAPLSAAQLRRAVAHLRVRQERDERANVRLLRYLNVRRPRVLPGRDGGAADDAVVGGGGGGGGARGETVPRFAAFWK